MASTSNVSTSVTVARKWTKPVPSATPVEIVYPWIGWDFHHKRFNPERIWMLTRNPTNTKLEIGSLLHVTHVTIPYTRVVNFDNDDNDAYIQIEAIHGLRVRDYIDVHISVAPHQFASSFTLRIRTEWFNVPSRLYRALREPLKENSEEYEIYMH